jgi:hypothetical protein
MSDRPFHDYLPPTISRPIGELMPPRQHATWQNERDHPDGAIAEMVDVVKAVGLPFMEANASLRDLRGTLDAGATNDELPYRVATAALLDGDDSRALAAVREAVGKISERTDAAAAQFRLFATNLERRHGAVQR